MRSWLLWQLADSAFPTGGFAHSGGLEAAYQHGALRGGRELTDYLRNAIDQLPYSALPFIHTAFSATRAFTEIDLLCEAFLSNHVANRASRLLGQAWLATCHRTFQVAGLNDFRSELLHCGSPGHMTPVFGRLAQLLDLNGEEAVRLFIFTQLRGWISSAVRLNIVGPLEGQRVQHQLGADMERCASQFGTIPLEEVAQTAPLLDLWQGTQDRLYSRLFQT